MSLKFHLGSNVRFLIRTSKRSCGLLSFGDSLGFHLGFIQDSFGVSCRVSFTGSSGFQFGCHVKFHLAFHLGVLEFRLGFLLGYHLGFHPKFRKGFICGLLRVKFCGVSCRGFLSGFLIRISFGFT